MRHGHLIAISAILILTSSCSWYRDLERSLVEDDQRQTRHSRSVSRKQYDQLLVKYEELSKKYEALKEGKPESSSLVDELQKGPQMGDSETVDVFNQQGAGTVGAAAPLASVPKDTESQLALYRRGLALKSSNVGEATKVFQQLENEGLPTIKVRAKYQIGEMLMQKQQYDLALQVFEDIIQNHAHSGVVLDSLKSAISCSDKLGVASKKEQYASILNDVFEAN